MLNILVIDDEFPSLYRGKLVDVAQSYIANNSVTNLKWDV